ncbi:uncharacterized protein B0H18DRAFT_986207 [Fomitopsis serialis]|uniref:uncharacterized protein n=1 Tax=Fomitopsis serialis TaxID=139415 RepID=UPI0020083DCC|nr:uncharacterized protein B0H18DRAFT_986207 [Neoantrodia serialis]KAH9932555.1 hypothetical protein B0H18DRAFT_986207 [Neoantrodia serialis]
MPTAWDVYAQELLPLGYGYPLWDPSPDPKAGEVEIGDVGFLENGQFMRLFNPTYSRDHPVNCVWGVPKDFRKLEIADRLINEEDLTFSSDLLCSRHVTKAEVNAKVEVESAVDLALKYNTTSSSGAILYIPTKAARRREVLRESSIMHDYLQKNYKTWHHYLHHHKNLKLEKKDLVFVRGWIKTAKWAVAAFADTSREESATIGGGHGPAKGSFSVDLSKQEALGGWTNVGLKREKDTVDQCIFVHFYQYTTRDAFHQWILKRKTSFDKVLNHISPKKRAHDCDTDEADEDKHTDKKRRIDGPEHDSEGGALLQLTSSLADRAFRKTDIDIVVTDTDELAASLLEHEVPQSRLREVVLVSETTEVLTFR